MLTLRTPRPRVCMLAALVVATAVLAGPPGTQARGGGGKSGGKSGGQTVQTTINLPALVLDNLCNADVVTLSGDLTITTTTTPHRNGGYTVQSRSSARDLRGSRIAPPPAIGYHGSDEDNAYSYYAPPPYPSTHRVVHWTKLVPEGDAPTMYLVLVIRETILADGTVVPVFERAYLVCSQPKNRHERCD